MKYHTCRLLRPVITIASVFLLISCAAGDTQFSQEAPAGFWYGLWHGVIAVIALIIHVFNDSVLVYEINNTGGWYDLGFLLGIICIWSGGSQVTCKSAADKKHEQEWNEVGNKVEIKVMRKLNEWAKEEKDIGSDKEWEEIGGKVEKKLKRIIREWSEKD